MRFSLASLISREQYFDDWQRSIHALDIPRELTDIVLLVDGTPELATRASKAFQEGGWKNVRVTYSGKQPVEHTDLMGRRVRIADRMNKLRTLVRSSNYTMVIEDDTLAPPHAFKRLFDKLERGVGFVSGVEVGRWGIPYVGAWKMDNIEDPNKVWSLGYRPEGYQEIDAGGLYCCIVRTEDFRTAKFRTNDFGPDFHFVHDLRTQGYKAYCDWSTKCVHLSGSARLIVSHKVVSIPFRMKAGHFAQDKMSYKSI